MTPAGVFTSFTVPGGARANTSGSDGNLWFTVAGAGKVGCLTPQGVCTVHRVRPPRGRVGRRSDHGRLGRQRLVYGLPARRRPAVPPPRRCTSPASPWPGPSRSTRSRGWAASPPSPPTPPAAIRQPSTCRTPGPWRLTPRPSRVRRSRFISRIPEV
jgi:hypothetical protein